MGFFVVRDTVATRGQ